MNVLAVNVSIRPESKVSYFPLGLAYIASAIKSCEYDLEILDIDANRYPDSYLVDYFRKNKFDVVCMGCIVTGYKYVKKMAEIIREFNPNARIIVGNSVASSIPDILLTGTNADIAVIGEGDITIIEVLNALKASRGLEGIRGIAYKKDGKVIKNPPREPIEDIDTIPFPDWDLFDMEKYIQSISQYGASDPLPFPREKARAFTISTARGCPFKCTFCYQVFRDVKYRCISPAVLVNELKRLKEKYRINYFIFHDDLSIFSKKHAQELAETLLREKADVYWVADCRANLFKADSDLELARLLKSAGCVGLGYSLENASRDILKMMNKNIDPEDFVRQAHILDKAGLCSWTSLVFGYPQETKETIKMTIEYCIKSGIYPSAGFLLVQPGTPMYEYAIEHGYIKDEEDYLMKLGDRQDFRMNMTKMSDEEFKKAVADAMEECNKRLNLNLKKAELMKTGYYRSPKKIA